MVPKLQTYRITPRAKETQHILLFLDHHIIRTYIGNARQYNAACTLAGGWLVLLVTALLTPIL